jgi:hypothetical protein
MAFLCCTCVIITSSSPVGFPVMMRLWKLSHHIRVLNPKIYYLLSAIFFCIVEFELHPPAATVCTHGRGGKDVENISFLWERYGGRYLYLDMM